MNGIGNEKKKLKCTLENSHPSKVIKNSVNNLHIRSIKLGGYGEEEKTFITKPKSYIRCSILWKIVIASVRVF